MSKKTLNITSLLSCNLKSRSLVHDLSLFIINSGEKDVVIDFSDVQFATRSFVDEFYNVFIKRGLDGVNVSIIGVPDFITVIFDAVEHPKKSNRVVSTKQNVKTFNSVDEMKRYFSNFNF